MGLILILVIMFAPMGFVGLIKIIKEKIFSNQSGKKQSEKAIIEEAA
jgi:hypothetical protein